jgi:shikimate O-hydroxycinnamoyltransferase
MATIYRTKSQMSSSPTSLSIQGVKVRPTSKSLVVPSVRTEDHWLSLSNLDRVVNPTFSSVILFYNNVVTSEKSFQHFTGSLKESLAKTLVHFYPLAGRLALGEDGLVDLHCNDEGALFFEASVESDLATIGGPKPMPEISGMDVARLGPGPTYIPDQLRTMPPLVIMVTRFTCGSIAVAINWHHSVADGSSGCHFVKSWSEMATKNEISVLPNHDRTLLKPRNPPNASLVNGYSTNNVEKLLDRSTVQSDLPTTPATLNSFQIDKSKVLELKAKVISEDQEHQQFSSVESVSGHLWRQMTKARAEAGQRDSSTRFFMFVDGRKKLGLPAGYFGNVVCSACAVASEDDILSKPVSYAASLIRAATRSISADYFQSLIDWVEIQGTRPSKSEHVNSLGHDVAATFWTFFPLYEVDFGWGKPNLAARNSPPRPLIDGIAVMPGSDGPGTMVALVNLHADRLERISRQSSFKAFFTRQTSDQKLIACA